MLAYLGAYVLHSANPSGGQTWAQNAAEQQRTALANFASDVQAGRYTPDEAAAAIDREAVSARADLYSGPVWTGQQRGAASNWPSGATIKWHAEGDDATCDLCDQRDGQIFTPATLPGFPGEGSFGQICEGGPNCRCWLEMIPTEAQP